MSKRKVSESAPVQVYLSGGERFLLARLAGHLDTSMSDVIRRGLEALERETLDPAHHPALAVIGMAGRERAPDGIDAARDHDHLLAEDEVGSWTSSAIKSKRSSSSAKKRRGH